MATFAPITTIPQLINLCQDDPENIGVSPSGEMFTYDFMRNTKRKVSREEASELLGLTLDIIDEIVNSNGHFVLPDPEEQEPVVNDSATAPSILSAGHPSEEIPFDDLPDEYDQDEFEMPDDLELKDAILIEEKQEELQQPAEPDRIQVLEDKVNRLISDIEQVLTILGVSQKTREEEHKEVVKLLMGLYL
jgi:hypothetical protein